MNTLHQILVIEDDTILGGALTQRLKLEGFKVVWAQNCAEALACLKQARPDYIVSDIVLPDGSGEDVFRQVQPWLGDTPILFSSAFGEIDQAVRLVKAGAEDYLTKPYDVDLLVERIRKRLSDRPGRLAQNPGAGRDLPPSGERLAAQLRRAAASDLPVLLTGETGVGKEVAARYLHSVSQRNGAPFVAVNCGAIPHELLESQFFGHERGAFTGAAQSHVGFFEEAGTGTLFLDEIGELEPRLQTALLRVLEDGKFRPVGSRRDKQFAGRVVAATNADIAALRGGRLFRDDLYFRLAVVEIAIEPLRARRIDIPALAELFMAEFANTTGKRFTLAPETSAALLDHDWPGNVRELRNRLQRATVFANAEALQTGDLFPERRLDDGRMDTLADARHQAEVDVIEKAILAADGRVGEAAKNLGISRTTLWKRRRKR